MPALAGEFFFGGGRRGPVRSGVVVGAGGAAEECADVEAGVEGDAADLGAGPGSGGVDVRGEVVDGSAQAAAVFGFVAPVGRGRTRLARVASSKKARRFMVE